MSSLTAAATVLSSNTRELIASTQAMLGWGTHPEFLYYVTKNSNEYYQTLIKSAHTINNVQWAPGRGGILLQLPSLREQEYLPIAHLFNNHCSSYFRSGYWCEDYAKITSWVPTNELKAFWDEVNRLNIQQIRAIFNAISHKELLSPMLEARALAANATYINKALEAGLRRGW